MLITGSLDKRLCGPLNNHKINAFNTLIIYDFAMIPMCV